jgi:hypothetical protein
MSSIGTIHKIADGFNRRYKVRKNTTSSVGTAHNQAIFAVPMELKTPSFIWVYYFLQSPLFVQFALKCSIFSGKIVKIL